MNKFTLPQDMKKALREGLTIQFSQDLPEADYKAICALCHEYQSKHFSAVWKGQKTFVFQGKKEPVFYPII